MKRIGLLSDNHSYFPEEVYQYFKEVDEIWHAADFGDLHVSDKLSEFKPLRGVYGNIDGQNIRIVHPFVQLFDCEGIKVMMTHIGGYPGKYAPNVKAFLAKENVQLFISGHSHILKVIQDKKLNLLHMNPGAAGKQGLHIMRTLIRFAIHEGKILEVEVIEIGKKTNL